MSYDPHPLFVIENADCKMRIEHSPATVLSKLAEVRIYGSSDPNYEGIDFQTFEHWVSLPSVRSLFGKAIETFDEFEWYQGSRTSNVTEINLQKSSVSEEDIARLLSGMGALKKFTYDYDERLNTIDGAHIMCILIALREHTGKTLEYLALTAHNSRTWCVGGPSLKRFEALKEARLPCNLYLKDGAAFEGADDEEDLKEWLDDIPCLFDLLPATMEKIEFDGELTMISIESLLYGSASFGDLKGSCVPNLKKICFHEAIVETKTMKMMAKAWKDGLRASGINLQL